LSSNHQQILFKKVRAGFSEMMRLVFFFGSGPNHPQVEERVRALFQAWVEPCAQGVLTRVLTTPLYSKANAQCGTLFEESMLQCTSNTKPCKFVSINLLLFLPLGL
jgi:hypothetical protein